jgi:uncharacterized protein (TIGR00255 family)
MIRSMTGFGEAVVETAGARLRAEIRTVNHRFFSTNLRLDRAVERFEPQIREWLRALLPRGHANVAIRLERDGASAATGFLVVDEDRARQYAAALSHLKELLGVSGQVDLALISRFSDILSWSDDRALPVAIEDVQAVVEQAGIAVIAMRTDEGRRLAADLDERLQAIERALADIAERAPLRVVAERDRMRRVLVELLADISIDEDRVAREIAMIAERWDVSEELVRLRSHLELFRESMDADPREPTGKRLSFLIQEMNREVNTIGSKANDAPIEHRVIAIKEEIERLREQVENVE